MYARLTIVLKIKLDRIDEAIKFFEENIVPL